MVIRIAHLHRALLDQEAPLNQALLHHAICIELEMICFLFSMARMAHLELVSCLRIWCPADDPDMHVGRS